MANFNTYQTRQLYVAKTVVTGDDAKVQNPGDIKVGSLPQDGLVDGRRIFFTYCNADGIITRSDTIPATNIVSNKEVSAADLAKLLMKHTVAFDTNAATLSNLVGKTLDCVITIHEVLDYDMSSTVSVVASVIGDATNTASTTAFHKALAEAIANALPKRKFPYLKVFSNGTEVKKGDTATGSANGVVLVQAPQKYVRGKLSNEPFDFTVAFHLHGSNTEDIVWGTDTVAVSDITDNEFISGTYTLADLEYFTLGERGDIYRGSTWPNNYEPTYMIDLTKEYGVFTLEYFWQGGAENVQKSPRMIQIAVENAADMQKLRSAISNAISPRG